MPDLAALKQAARAAIVMPAVFALADKVIGRPQTSIFAAFGSFAMLVLVEFGGPARTRLAAYLGLACTGATFITVGTLCSRQPWLAAAAMAAVGFATLFAGAFSGYIAAGTSGAILTFVLPVTIRAPNAAIPDRLLGWGIAAGAGTCAAMLLWPRRRDIDFRLQAAGAIDAVAALIVAVSGETAERARAAGEAVAALERRFLGSQHRPVGRAAATAALASLSDELEWLLSFLAPSDDAQPLELACAEDAEAIAATEAVLGASAARLRGGTQRPDLERLDAAREAVASAVVQRLPALADEGTLPQALDPPFRIRVSTSATRQIATYALLASGAAAPATAAAHRSRASTHEAIEASERLVLEHANVGSVWLQNSVRGAVGLAVAVYIAQRTGLQHGFWVVLGTLSVLRSNALGTGWSIMSALAGTAVGLVVGALLVIGIGTHPGVLWGVLPLAVLLAAYAPRAISFAAGQAGFTVVLFILFNIIQPVGWHVGVVRVEDVAIGFAISLAVGLLFWPRGAGAQLERDLAAAYTTGADFVLATARRLVADGEEAEETRTGRSADAALHRLDDAFRQYLTERSATRVDLDAVGGLVAGAARLRRVGLSLEALGSVADGAAPIEPCARTLEPQLAALRAWYVAFGDALVTRRTIPSPDARDEEGKRGLLACLREAVGDGASERSGLVLLWASQHLDTLGELEARLSEQAALIPLRRGRATRAGWRAALR